MSKKNIKGGSTFIFQKGLEVGIFYLFYFIYRSGETSTNKDFSGEKCIFNLGLITKKRLKFIEKIYFKLLERGGEMIKKCKPLYKDLRIT